MTGPKDIVIGALSLILIVVSVTLAFSTTKNKTLKKTVELYETREQIYNDRIEKCSLIVKDLRSSIDAQNNATELARIKGEEAQRAQDEADFLEAALGLAEHQITELIESQRDFEELVSTADVCQTYELVLRSISGEVQ